MECFFKVIGDSNSTGWFGGEVITTTKTHMGVRFDDGDEQKVRWTDKWKHGEENPALFV